MRTDNLLRVDAMNVLIKELGEVETERFVYLLKREQFDYTEWQRTLWNDMTVDEVYKLAADREKARTTGEGLPYSEREKNGNRGQTVL